MNHRPELAALPAGARVVIRLPNGPELASALLDLSLIHI